MGYSPALQETAFHLQILPATLRKASHSAEGLRRADTEARVSGDGPESQSWQEEGTQEPGPAYNETHIYDPVPGIPPPFLVDGCTCEKATVRASSSGPVIFSARSIHTWVE